MIYITIIVLVLLVPIIHIISVNNELKKSKYTEVSGNTLKNILNNKGNYGEFLTFRILEKCGEDKILCNIYLPNKKGETTEIDLISVNRKGIFVYESKNYSGWIFGDDKNKMWTQTLENGKKNRFFNPVFQNKAHINAIDAQFNKQFTNSFFSYIVFSQRCELKKISISLNRTRVIKRNELINTITNDKKNATDILTSEEIMNIFERLKTFTLVSDDVKRKHIDDIKARL